MSMGKKANTDSSRYTIRPGACRDASLQKMHSPMVKLPDDTAVQRWAREGAQRPTCPSVCNGLLAGMPLTTTRDCAEEGQSMAAVGTKLILSPG